MLNEIRCQRSITREQYEEMEAIKSSMKQIQGQTVKERIEKLNQRRVIGATCAATGFDVMKDMNFKIVILDECSQMLEPQSLLPIAKFNCRKLVRTFISFKYLRLQLEIHCNCLP